MPLKKIIPSLQQREQVLEILTKIVNLVNKTIELFQLIFF